MRITEKQIAEIKRRLNTLKDLNYLMKRGTNISKLSRTLDNKIGGYRAAYNQAEQKNLEHFHKFLEKTRKEILQNIFGKIFGFEKLSNLTKAQKRFLCIDDL